MVDPQVIVKANYNRTLITVRVTAINSPDWTEIVGTRLDLSYNDTFTNIFYSNLTTHYKVRGYLEHENPGTRVYGRITLTKSDNTTHQSTFNFVVPNPILGTVKDDNGTQYITSIRKMDTAGNLSGRDYTNTAIIAGAAYFDIVADEDGEMVVANKWATPVLVQNITQGTSQVSVADSSNTTVAVNNGDTVRVSESVADSTFRTFSSYEQPLCKGVSAHVSVMPSMDKFCHSANDRTRPGVRFFYYFNCYGTLTSFPEGSFDTRYLAYLEQMAFDNFNDHGALVSLPEGSFDTSNIVNDNDVNAFHNFNSYGALTSLPDGSFDFDNMPDKIFEFQYFNDHGALTSLPAGSFGFSNFGGHIGHWYFDRFNQNGAIASLPAGAFHFKNGATGGGIQCFGYFNSYGALTSLPEHSFNFTLVTTSSTFGFGNFNNHGALTSLPAGSFRFSSLATPKASSDFENFNNYGALTSLPAGSFNTECFTEAKHWIFKNFNNHGALTSLPVGSFNFDNMTKITGQSPFENFNSYGALETLPKGSFSFKNLTTWDVGNPTSFAAAFNRGGNLRYLPIGAFSIDGLGVSHLTTQVFNDNSGKLVKSDTDYNPRFINTSTLPLKFDYYDPATQTSYYEDVSSGNPPKYYQADLFEVFYTADPSFTTNIESTYLSGQTITFTATAVDPDYIVVPTINTAGGTSVVVIDHGNDTYTFKMPQDDINVSFTVSRRPSHIILVADEAGTMVVRNKWQTPVIVTNITQGTSPTTVTAHNTVNVPVAVNDEVTVAESSGGMTFRRWTNEHYGLAEGVDCHISSIPEMDVFTSDPAGTTTDGYFFYEFCRGNNGKGITSLPEGSFDTSGITGVNYYFFSGFNMSGKLVALPTGSFNISNIVAYQYNAFSSFNESGELTSLPAGSFGVNSTLMSISSSFCKSFNNKGKLTSLPANSFKLDNITSIGNNAFENFNRQGKLTSLPTDSFITTNVTTLDHDAFAWFNYRGELTSLPNRSFDLIGLTSVSNMCFCGFNNGGKLTALGTGSFRTDNLVTVGNDSFEGFNQGGELTSLPTGSFKLDNVTSVGTYGFASFNTSGKLTALPVGSFGFGNLITAGGYTFQHFNQQGQLTSLPTGSFNFDNLTTVGVDFCAQFNDTGALTSLPTGSFGTTSLTSVGTYLYYEFNDHGHIEKDTVNYNPNCVNPYTSGTIDVHYWNGSATTTESVAAGAPFYFKTS